VMGETAAVEKHGLRESGKTGSVFFSVHVFY
jgi:hypothetical protein